jgi:hypothetical protein
MIAAYAFQYAVLRYIHDLVTQEFLNIGVVVYCKEAHYFKAKISQKYRRLSNTFLSINGEYYRRVANHIYHQIGKIQSQIRAHSNGEANQLAFFGELPDPIEVLLAQVLTPDDSSITFSGYGGGLTDDLEAELSRLYDRLVEQYTEKEDYPSRTDKEVW